MWVPSVASILFFHSILSIFQSHIIYYVSALTSNTLLFSFPAVTLFLTEKMEADTRELSYFPTNKSISLPPVVVLRSAFPLVTMEEGLSFHSCTESHVLMDLALTAIPLYSSIITFYLLCKVIPISIQTCHGKFYDKKKLFHLSFIHISIQLLLRFCVSLREKLLKHILSSPRFSFLLLSWNCSCQGLHWLWSCPVLSPHFPGPLRHLNPPLHTSWSTSFARPLRYHLFLVFLHLNLY